MRISVTASVLLALGFLHPVGMSFSALPEDVEGSGHDLDSSGSGSGDWSEQSNVEITKMKARPNSKDQTIAITHLPATDIESEFVVVANSKSFLENEQIIRGIISGGVTGVILAALLTALLIYKWKNKGDGGYILGQMSHRDEVIV